MIKGTLATIKEQVKATKITRTALIFVGRVFDTADFTDSRLYHADHKHILRPKQHGAGLDQRGKTKPPLLAKIEATSL